MDILKRIVARKKEEIDAARRRVPMEAMRAAAAEPRERRSFRKALEAPGPRGANIIAEIKRASPSKGPLCLDLDPAVLARAYASGGAAALSVLTDRDFFRGGPEDLAAARNAVALPVLRKDFLIDAYQIYESRAMGADAVLLICRILSHGQLSELLSLSQALDMDALVEIHTREDLAMARQTEALLIGINNRNLSTFDTDIATAMSLAAGLAPGQIPVAASGIAARRDVEANLARGIYNFLVGESLVRSAHPASQLSALLGGAPSAEPR
jgi:indole-3-glycerol phosphate synthase